MKGLKVVIISTLIARAKENLWLDHSGFMQRLDQLLYFEVEAVIV